MGAAEPDAGNRQLEPPAISKEDAEALVASRVQALLEALALCSAAGGDAAAAFSAALPDELRQQLISEVPFLAALL